MDKLYCKSAGLRLFGIFFSLKIKNKNKTSFTSEHNFMNFTIFAWKITQINEKSQCQ